MLNILAVAAGLGLALAAVSLSVGWSLPTLLLFWLLITPALALNIPRWMDRKHADGKSSILGLVLFYVLMVFMIYEHDQTDYFRLMMYSLVINLGILGTWIWANKRTAAQPQPEAGLTDS
ncbi:MAG: hypothetical protein D6722_08760 [Bacteroidetes bacterium]|nr:MAG: hypothetical protein D6722_08760 [Bacteroidota bacterium]